MADGSAYLAAAVADLALPRRNSSGPSCVRAREDPRLGEQELHPVVRVEAEGRGRPASSSADEDSSVGVADPEAAEHRGASGATTAPTAACPADP